MHCLHVEFGPLETSRHIHVPGRSPDKGLGLGVIVSVPGLTEAMDMDKAHKGTE